MQETFVQLRGIKKSYEGVYALKGIDLDIRKGEVHCLAGGNGCGKSTLIKIISGVIEPTEGEIVIDGEKMRNMQPMDAISKGIQVIYQDFAVFPNLTVAENIAFNTEILAGTRLVHPKRRRELALKAMEMIGADMDPDACLGELSMASKQMVALCRAIINRPKLLILDEPTIALTAKEVQKLWTVVKNLRDQGIAVLLVDHKFDEIKEISDRLTVLRNGTFVSSGEVNEYGHKRFQRDMTGHDFSTDKYRPEPSDENILTVEQLSSPGLYEDVSFSLNKGDVIGITGLLGSGRSEIAGALFGLYPAAQGRILLNGKEIRIRGVRDAVKHEIGYVPEDRLTEGLFRKMSITENIAAASLRDYLRGLTVLSEQMTADGRRWMEKTGIVAAAPEVHVSALSGGNAQKVVLSKWLNTAPKLLILNGPSVGMDIGAKAEIHKILHELAAGGMGIVIVTDDLAELVENCNKILVVRDGRIVKETDNAISKSVIERILMGEEEREAI